MTTLLERYTAYHLTRLEQQQVASALGWGDILAPVRALVQHAGNIGARLDLQGLALLQRHLLQEATVAA